MSFRNINPPLNAAAAAPKTIATFFPVLFPCSSSSAITKHFTILISVVLHMVYTRILPEIRNEFAFSHRKVQDKLIK